MRDNISSLHDITTSETSEKHPREVILKHYFVIRTDTYAYEEREKGGWVRVDKEMPPYLLQNHLKGRTTTGTYGVLPHVNTTLWTLYDLAHDTEKQEQVEKAKHCLKWLAEWHINRGIPQNPLRLCSTSSSKLCLP